MKCAIKKAFIVKFLCVWSLNLCQLNYVRLILIRIERLDSVFHYEVRNFLINYSSYRNLESNPPPTLPFLPSKMGLRWTNTKKWTFSLQLVPVGFAIISSFISPLEIALDHNEKGKPFKREGKRGACRGTEISGTKLVVGLNLKTRHYC